MADIYVLEVQKWLNQTYGENSSFNYHVNEDGQTGNQTVQGLIRALQIELSSGVDGAFGSGTSSAFKSMFPNGLSESTYSDTPGIQRITKILQGGFYCKGINPYAFDGIFNFSTTNAVIKLKTDAGLTNANGTVDAIFFQALLNTDGYTLANGGDANIRDVQQRLNRKYYNIIGLIPTNGLYSRPTHMGIVKALQYEVGASIDGYFGLGTQRLCPALQMYGNNDTNLVYILQYILYCSGFDPNGFDGAFGNGVKRAVTNFQNFVKLTADGVCGQQTWASLMSSAGDTTRTVTACDTRFEITDDRAKLLVKNGYQIVGRYIVGGDFKELRANEPEIIFKNGLKFFPIYQANGTSESDYSMATGIKDAQKANMAVLKHKLPKKCTVYFAVDFDCLDYQITNSIIPYFKSLAENFNSNYEIGIYATRNTCKRVCASVDRVTGCFVSDMSTGYSGNLGYFLPNNWNYDQIANITLNDSQYGSLEIDKVVYNGIIQAVSELESDETDTNLEPVEILHKLYDWACEYKPNYSILEKNKLVLQYLRSVNYADWKFNILIGSVDNNFVEFVKGQPNYDDSKHNPTKIFIKIKEFDYTIGVEHLSAVIEAILNRELNTTFSDLGGWAGDLLTFIGKIQEKEDSTHIYFSDDEIYNYLGGRNAGEYSFNLEDLLQDVEAVNIYPVLESIPIYKVYEGNGNNFARFDNFIHAIAPSINGDDNTLYNNLYQAAYHYTSKENILSEALTQLFYTPFDANRWQERMARIFAKRLLDLRK